MNLSSLNIQKWAESFVQDPSSSLPRSGTVPVPPTQSADGERMFFCLLGLLCMFTALAMAIMLLFEEMHVLWYSATGLMGIVGLLLVHEGGGQ